MAEPLLCPECGWSGTETKLEDGDCPVCAASIEFID